ncbi:MAG TPA: hypothetical protein DCS82_12335 [Rhodospirillaceae bacterium]|nr:hypothetical protein [Rhodospirillaceae bacterium]HAA91548.1 hypothetical protein [Rhodospirillaceae bacterium]HAT36496.1 hypothetical protein [Rhodospirillaceae bacterium]|tara:strand:- start:274 stop:864 length:591 start_codon:yes stop_codon:yes gene_type:complete
MLFACFLIDKPGMVEKRDELLQIHRDYLGESKDKIYLAGPLMNDTETKKLGSLYVIEQPDRAATDAWLAEEPFTKNGLFGSQHVYGWKHLKGDRDRKHRLCLYFHLDGPKGPDKRALMSEQHVDYLLAFPDNLFAVGPLFHDSDKTEFEDRIGSIFIVDFPERAHADEWRAQEPYTRNEVYDRCWGYMYDNLWRSD